MHVSLIDLSIFVTKLVKLFCSHYFNLIATNLTIYFATNFLFIFSKKFNNFHCCIRQKKKQFFFVAFSAPVGDLLLRLGCIFAAISLHKTLLQNIFHAPITFFDITPAGRILSRFAKDIDVLDITLPEILNDLIYVIFEVNQYQYFNFVFISYLQLCTIKVK